MLNGYSSYLDYIPLYCIVFKCRFTGGGLIGEGGAYLRGGLVYFLRKLYDNFPPTQRNVCKTTMYSNNFNTTLNVLRCSTINFSTIQLYICFKMFMTRRRRYVILAKMKANYFIKYVSSETTYFSINGRGGG